MKHSQRLFFGAGVLFLASAAVWAQNQLPANCTCAGLSCGGSTPDCANCACCSITPAAKSCTCCTVSFDCLSPPAGWACTDISTE